MTSSDEILHPDWVDHAHPEVTGPIGVKQAVQSTRAARPNLTFAVHTILGDDDLLAVVGSAGQSTQPPESPGHLLWLIRFINGRMAEMWTYQHSQATP